MKQQNYSNHSRLSFLFHFVTYPAMLALLVGAIIYLLQGDNTSRILPWMFLLMTLVMISIATHARSFALKAQDRAIRAEENLRYFILSGKRLNQQLTMGQIIGLRFASDEEFVGLVDKAVAQNLRSREIKKSVKNWRADHHRV